MTKNTSKVTIHMVSSLDGFIARKDNSISWLESSDSYEKGITLSEEDVERFIKNIDCYVIGSRTYEHALELGWPYGDIPVIVLTHRELTTDKENVEFYQGDLDKLVNEKLKPIYCNIWIAGGSMIVKDLIRQGLADNIIISNIPVILEEGKLFFDYIEQEQRLHLKDATAYKDGMVELWYEIIKE